MTVTHSTITDPNNHENKGVNSAPANSVYVATGTGTGNWTILPDTDPSLVSVPIGIIVAYPGSSIPSKWLACFGQAISRTTYSALFAKVGTTYGVGDGTTTFNLPDCRGRILAGRDNAGNVSSNRMANQINGDNLGASGGVQTVTVGQSNIPPLTGVLEDAGAHTHTLSGANDLVTITNANNVGTGSQNLGSGSTPVVGNSTSHTHALTVNSGGGSSHNNVMPTIITNMIIYTGVA